MMNEDKIKEALEQRLRVLSARVEEIEGNLRSKPDPDFEERATESEGDEVLEGLEDSALSEITQIQNALSQLKNGSYGECQQCGSEIGEKRLEAVPYTSLCINCADKASRAHP